MARIAGRAFSGCPGIAPLVIPPGVVYLGGAAFAGFTGPVYFQGPAPTFELYDAGWERVFYCLNTAGWAAYPLAKDVWTAAVQFDAQGGSLADPAQTGFVGNAYGTLPAPDLAEHAFAGWWTEPVSAGTHVYTNSIVPYVLAPFTLYARWTVAPAIGAEAEVIFQPGGLAFQLPPDYVDCTVEFATVLASQAWNWAPLPPDEYLHTNGTVQVSYSSNRPLAYYRARFPLPN